jgi:hypothetical protein
MVLGSEEGGRAAPLGRHHVVQRGQLVGGARLGQIADATPPPDADHPEHLQVEEEEVVKN